MTTKTANKPITLAARKTWNQQKWGAYVREGLNDAATGVIKAGVRMLQFKEEAKCCKGGSEFSSLCEKLFNLSPSMASRWVKIGQSSNVLLKKSKNLPTSFEALYLVSTLSDEEINQGIEDGIITQESTQKDIKKLKQGPTAKRGSTVIANVRQRIEDDEKWEKLLEKYDNEDLATAVWDKIIIEKDAEKIQSGKFDKKRMAKKLYGDTNDPNMLPSQVASALGLDADEISTILGLKKKVKRSYVFEITEDVVQLEKELENPADEDAMRSTEAKKLYNKFKRIVELWSEIIGE